MGDFGSCGGRAVAAATSLIGLLAGCAPPLRVAAIPTKPAITDYGEKATGEDAFLILRGDEPGGVLLSHRGTLAQSGEGTLGDRVFREDEHGFVEACRYVAKGRICDLVTLPDGTHLGGGVHWVIPKGARATPRSSGWVTQGSFLRPTAGLGQEAQAVNSLAPILMGRAYHCRFTQTGAACLPVPAIAKEIGYTLLGSFSLKDGATTREVLWIGIFGDVSAPGVDRTFGIRELHRCETTEESAEVVCKVVHQR